MLDKDKLLAPRADTDSGLPEDDVEIPGVGTVHVRALTRGEVYQVQRPEQWVDSERKILAFGMLDPVLTEKEAGRWQESAPAGEIDVVVDRIRELSGITEGASKSGVQDAGEGPDAGVRVLPGAEAEHDGG